MCHEELRAKIIIELNKMNEDLERVIERYSNQLKSLGIHEKVIDILVNRTSRCMWALMSKLEKDDAEKFSYTISGLTSLIIEFLSTNIVLKEDYITLSQEIDHHHLAERLCLKKIEENKNE
jgi:hypothetical protein